MATDLEAAAYMKIGDIKGEAMSKGYEEFMKISFLKIEIQRAVDRAGVIEFKNPIVRFPVEQASPELMLACATGKILPSATLIITRPGKDGGELAYYKVTFSNVVVSSYSSTSTGGNERPTEEMTLGYTEVEWTYINFDDDTGRPVKTTETGKISVPK